MQQNQIQAIKEQIKDKIEKGDFVMLSKCLNVPQHTARARYRRENQSAVLTMNKIVKEKEVLIIKVKKYATNLHNAQ